MLKHDGYTKTYVQSYYYGRLLVRSCNVLQKVHTADPSELLVWKTIFSLYIGMYVPQTGHLTHYKCHSDTVYMSFLYCTRIQ